MGIREFLAKVIQALEAAGIPYMICGSISSNLQGQFRSTNDVDIIIDPTQEQLESLIRILATDFYADLESARQALQNRFMFNVISGESGLKVDFILRKNRPYDKEEFGRRIRSSFMGMEMVISTPEDTILSKLLWAKAADSERQLRDVLGVIQVQAERLDQAYLRRWAKQLGLEEILEKLLSEADRSS